MLVLGVCDDPFETQRPVPVLREYLKPDFDAHVVIEHLSLCVMTRLQQGDVLGLLSLLHQGADLPVPDEDTSPLQHLLIQTGN